MKLYAVLSMGLVCVLGLSACGNSSSDTNASGSSTPTPSRTCATVPGITDSTITIGVVFPKSGTAASTFSNFDVAAQLRMNEMNALDGINGRKIRLKIYDDRNDPRAQNSVAQQALKDGVFGIIAASQQQSMYPILKQANVPIAGVPNLPPYATDLNAFGVTGAYSTGYTSTAAAQRFRKIKARSIATVTLKTPGALNSARGFVATLPSQALKSALPIQSLTSSSSSTSAIAKAIVKSKADAVNVIAPVSVGQSLTKSLKSLGAEQMPVMVNGLIDPATVLDAQGALDGAIGVPHGFVPLQLNTPEVKRYVAGMVSAGANPYASFAPLGYIAADVMIAGLSAAGQCPTREDFIRIERGVTDYTAGNMLPGKISFAPGVTPDGDPAKCSWFITVRGDSLLPDTGPTCGQLLKT
ncbi:MAG: ABC transporter substrate-binding protein [Candidatus Nanopelagicales bacterium]|nr:ABC transporter substrate-binding protein [Candidatus Nanopelagicales bacterium]